tara:strand:- start:1759 stop:2364 length:606 start_codon:yes stop_codon:yes gene_type:complete
MSKTVFFICLLFGFNSLYAQGKFELGVKAGLNITSFSGETEFALGGYSSRSSFHFGALAEIPIGSKISVQSELLYSSKGAMFDFGTSNDGDYILNYLEIPVLGKYYITSRLTTEIGASLGFLMSAKRDAKNAQGTRDVKDRYKSTDVTMVFGFSYKLQRSVFLSLRYNRSLININDSSVFPNGEKLKNQNSVFQLSVGYGF